ncbi:dicer-like protein-like protein 2 [Massariosphaeria phaeospora]|uniref:Dicer-like protein-like protein 2 n=1 Tax=Massariosphaeria phaeospora TaxID=100035 RepID=A0A7C8MRE3_9PLEO|nr:dicer-like protein-like protein 2 [Massariosphaeria phaeospora]
MDSTEDLLVNGAASVKRAKTESFRLRSYQAEMVDESLRANIIVAMDTGSGKTALARTAAELERCKPDQRIWFLAPTVTLCEQQFEVFKTNLPGYGIQMISGRDNVDHWSDQNTWNAVLRNVRIVISTHKVLLDALTHAFVKMSNLALLIFDEAHHCTSNHPANMILRNFYLPLVQDGSKKGVPKILGLSASPVMKARANSIDLLRELEENMNSIARTPKTHRSELIRFVHKPELLRVNYGTIPGFNKQSRLLLAVENAFNNYDITNDPYVKMLLAKRREGHDTSHQLKAVATSQSTYCLDQLKVLVAKAKAMSEELGPSATEWYLHQCISKFDQMVKISDQQLFDWSDQEKQHLLGILKSLGISEEPPDLPISLDHISPKVEKLIEVLIAESGPEFTGIVFIEQRVWVATLAVILSTHPRTKDRFSIGTFIGTSQSTKRKTCIANLVEPRNQEATLDDFRMGKTTLILTTSVLEEGIDISSCHFVACFERPKNLKSFVQRRGRARKQLSKYFIFMPNYTAARAPESWETLEEEMKQAYLDDLRQAKQAEERELEEEEGERNYRVADTGALLTLDDASPHLHHFCALLGSGPYVDTRPQFKFDESPDHRITAEVILPISVDPSVRTAQSSERWKTERMAKKDAAFEAYTALHRASLVNDNLLPSTEASDEIAELQIPDHTPSLVEVSPTFDPWVLLATHKHQDPMAYHRTLLKLKTVGEEPFYMVMMTSCAMPIVPELELYWNETKRYSVETSRLPDAIFTKKQIKTMQTVTRKIMFSIYGGRMEEERYDFLWLLVPSNPPEHIWDSARLCEWVAAVDGSQQASSLIQQGSLKVQDWGLVSPAVDQRKYIITSVKTSATGWAPTGKVDAQLQVIRVPKRRDFLHQIVDSNPENPIYTRSEWVDASDCIVGKLPASYCIFALLVPSILHRYEVFMIAEALRTTQVKAVSFDSTHLSLLVRALTSSNTDEAHDYQRLEFLGDCILKFIASLHVMASKLTWPEHYLTEKKGRIVSNGYLARATMAAGLEKYIITTRFTGAKWSPRYAGNVLMQPIKEEKKMRSSKLLADVIESLIGASYTVGGFPKAFTCVQTLLPLENWTPIPEANDILLGAVLDGIEVQNLATLEALIGYKFNKTMLLLEALTHPSYHGPNVTSSYQRLEFLGDAVLDYIISKRLYAHLPDLSHQKMHAIRTAMVNGPFLAFRMFEMTVEEEKIDPSTLQPETFHRCLWQFLRHGSHQLIEAREVAVKQHQEAREKILDALGNDTRFPWHLISLTDAPKFLSDIVESVIGAIYVDSHGSISTCEAFIRHLGILDCFERILANDVDCLHPKERLGILAVDKRVQYVQITDDAQSGNGNTAHMAKCQVKVDGQDVGGPVEGLKRLNAETIAAWKATRIIEGLEDVEMSSEEEWQDADEHGGVQINDTS